MKGRPKGEGRMLKHGGKGTLYDDGVYQTQLKVDQGKGTWRNCIPLGVEEWDEVVEEGGTEVWIVDSFWRLTYTFTVEEGKVYGYPDDTLKGPRFLMPIPRCRKLR